MAAAAALMLRFVPLLAVERRAHRDSLPLDGLRGLLASSVLFHHAEIWFVYAHSGRWDTPASRLYTAIGPAAVTVFFFISGYLFWDKALRKPERVSWSQLLPNRARRILPAYWAAVLLILLSCLVLSHFRLQERGHTVTKEIAEWLVGGFPHLGDTSLNGVNGVIVSAGVFWTLRMEWMFYGLLPLLLWFRKAWRLPLLFAGAKLLSILLTLVSNSHFGKMHAVFWELPTQFCSMMFVGFSIGMIAAYRPWNERVRRSMTSPWAAALALVCVALTFKTQGAYTVAQSLLLAPLFLTVVAGNSFAGLFSSRPMRALGQISYSVYILHGVLLFDLLHLWNQHSAVAAMSRTTFALLIWGIGMAVALIATLSYWLIERPFSGGAPVAARVKGGPGLQVESPS